MSVISNLFGGHAPFKQLQSHMAVARETAHQLAPLFDHLVDGDQKAVKEVAKTIFTLEREADEIKHKLRGSLPRSLFMPVDRRDLLQVLHNQDSIADCAEDIAGLFLQREMVVPLEMVDDLKALVADVIGVVDLAHQVIGLMDELVAVGFTGQVAVRVEKLVTALNDAESRTDQGERALMRVLFSLEDELTPISVVFWYRTLEWLGDVADHAETCANTVRLIIAR